MPWSLAFGYDGMKLLSALKRWATRSYTERGEWILGHRNTKAGIAVSLDDSLKVAAVFACVRVLAESIASLPLTQYRRLPGGGKERAIDHPLYWMLHDSPNSFQDMFQFVELLVEHLCFRGNHYSQKIISRGGKLLELWPLSPDKMKPVLDRKSGLIVYEHQLDGGRIETFSQSEIFHVRGLPSHDFVKGLAVLDFARETVGLAIAAEEHGARFFSNGVQSPGVVQHPNGLTDGAYNRLKQDFEERYQGVGNHHKPLLLEEGMTWQSIGLTNEQSQFLETRKFQVTEICRWFRVPPHMIGDLDRATFSNIEHQSLEFVTYSLMPWVVRIERALNKALLTPEEQKEYFFKFNVNALLRGDTKTRFEAYQIARNNGWLNVDEIRELEDLNPLPDGKGQIYVQPLNMKEVGATEEDQGDGDSSDNETGKKPENDKPEPTANDGEEVTRTVEKFSTILSHAIDRCLKREAKQLGAKSKPAWSEILERHRGDLEPVIKTALVFLESDSGQAGSVLDAWLKGWDSRSSNVENESTHAVRVGLEISRLESTIEGIVWRTENKKAAS